MVSGEKIEKTVFSVFHNDPGLQSVMYTQVLSCKENDRTKERFSVVEVIIYFKKVLI